MKLKTQALALSILSLATISCKEKNPTLPVAENFITIETEKKYSVKKGTEEADKLFITSVTTFNKDGNEIESHVLNLGNSNEEKSVSEYNDKKLISKKTVTNVKSGEKNVVTYTYNAQNNLTEVKTVDGKGEVVSWSKNEYKNGLKVKHITLAHNGTPSTEARYKHDAKGNIIESAMHTYVSGAPLDEPMNKTEFKYDGFNREIESVSYFGPMKVSTKTTKYERDRDLLLREVKLETTGGTHVDSYKYTFDSEGRWTKMIEFKNGVAVEIIERTIVIKKL